jgi:hypothetical protein
MVIRSYGLIGVNERVRGILFGIELLRSHRPVVVVGRLWQGRRRVWTMYRHQKLLPNSYASVSERPSKEENVKYRVGMNRPAEQQTIG